MPTAKLYYEAHITIDPVFDERRAFAGDLAAQNNFRLAKLIMRKREADDEQPAQDDTFMTGHGTDLDDIRDRTRAVVKRLQVFGFKVRRYKIEDTILDSRSHDELGLLS